MLVDRVLRSAIHAARDALELASGDEPGQRLAVDASPGQFSRRHAVFAAG